MEETMMGSRVPSKSIHPSQVPIIKKRILDGEFLNRIAADYDVNPGRISEIKTGQRFAEIPPAP
jgi:hypothetical protein